MNLFNLFQTLKPAWKSYLGCRNQLWWPLSFLLLTPIGVLIIAIIIPLSLESVGWIHFNYRLLNGTYLLLATGAIYCALFPFLDGLYRVIRAYLQDNTIDNDSGFEQLLDSQAMGKALGPVMLLLGLLTALGSFFKPLSLITLIAYACSVFTPILCLDNPLGAWKKGIESFQFSLNNKKLLRDVWVIRVLILFSFIMPIKIIMLLSDHSMLHLLAIIAGIPLLIFLVVLLLPFYFFYPAFVYTQVKL